MFDAVSSRYDLTNTLLSLGQDRRWRTATTAAVGARTGDKVLDVAAGTAVSTIPFTARGAFAVASDFSVGMLTAGADRDVPRVAADALALPFADASFDAVTISFGLRNVSDVDAAIAEFARVTRPGGRLVICEFSRPVWNWFDRVYREYLLRPLPWIADRVSSNPEAYRYLAESIRAWPDQQAVADRIGAAGWTNVGWRSLTFGIVALHRATRVTPGANAG